MYNIANRALHEGAAAGAMLRQLRDVPNPTALQMRAAGRSAKTLVGDVSRVGSSTAAETFNAWVPFSGAMIQSWNSIGSAMTHAVRNNPTRAMAAISLPMIPAIMEAVNNSMLGPEHSDWYWNTLTDEQRNNNMIFGIPGLPPERSILIPVSPEWTLARSMAIEMVDAVTHASVNAHYPGEKTGENGAHIMAAFVRVFDVPVPPLIQALFANAGYNLRVGPQHHNGQVQWPISIRKLTQGEQISGDRGRSRYVDAAIDSEVEGIFRALVGTVGSTFIGVTEAFRQGSSESLVVGKDMALDQLMIDIKKQTRYFQPLYSGSPTLRPNSFNEVADSNRVKKDGMKRLGEAFEVLQTDGRVISMDFPLAFEGNSVQPSDDPIVKIAGQSLEAANFHTKEFSKAINAQRDLIQDLRSSTRINGELVSIPQRDKRIDEHEMIIKGLEAKQNVGLQFIEDAISDSIVQALNIKEYEFSFDDYYARPNLGEGLIVKAPLKPRRASR